MNTWSGSSASSPPRRETGGVALAADTHDGVFETGVDVLDTLTDWLLSRLPSLARY
ncbi:hypothetical protein B0172_02770 [Mycobacterium avium subsp. paratuberculosis]|nr:hypothetical protein B0172_02770 [Mycobacterium avium subsp. paratuberculosis]OVF04058.1 hypothetical protein B0173_01770 [Mycobacterium avium subsp. paratuberculosis]